MYLPAATTTITTTLLLLLLALGYLNIRSTTATTTCATLCPATSLSVTQAQGPASMREPNPGYQDLICRHAYSLRERPHT